MEFCRIQWNAIHSTELNGIRSNSLEFNAIQRTKSSSVEFSEMQRNSREFNAINGIQWNQWNSMELK